MFSRIRQRYLDLLGSIYIYNEHRGYTAIDRVLEAVVARDPDDHALIAAIARHREDERKHYLMFRRWFERRGTMPLAIDRTCGHIDRFVELTFGRRIDTLETRAVVASDALFSRLCRVIALTERRGFRQVEILLRHRAVRQDKVLMKIFRIIHEDEPAHWAPYEGWNRSHAMPEPSMREKLVDAFIHAELLFLKLPALFLNPALRRLADWPDASDRGETESGAPEMAIAGT